MSDFLQNVVFLTIGSLGTLIVQYVTNRQTAATMQAAAQSQRRFEAGRDAYRAAAKALRRAREIASGKAAVTPDQIIEDVVDIYDAVSEARLVLGLPAFSQVRSRSMLEAVFNVPMAVERGMDIEAAKDRALATINEEDREIQEAWGRAIEGR